MWDAALALGLKGGTQWRNATEDVRFILPTAWPQRRAAATGDTRKRAGREAVRTTLRGLLVQLSFQNYFKLKRYFLMSFLFLT